MIVKVEMLLDADEEKFKELYKGDERSVLRIISDGLDTSIRYGDEPIKVILIESSLMACI
jgi:hypothetical protein